MSGLLSSKSIYIDNRNILINIIAFNITKRYGMVPNMNGEEYFKNFHDVADRIHTIQASPMAIKASGGLALKLADLYFEEDLMQIGASPEPGVLEKSRETIAERQPRTGKERIAKHMWFVKQNHDQVVEDSKDLVIKGVTDPFEVAAFASMCAERDGVNACIAEHHDNMLSKALVELQKHGSRGKTLDERLVSRVVKESINGQRKPLAEMLTPWQTILLAHYDSDPKGSTQQYSLDVIRNRDVPIPSWLTGTTNPDGAGQLLSSLISETEMLVVLNEWVVDRGLPYLPIIAPVFYETGPYNHKAGNPHADLFLCSLIPGRNDIIPIQVKKSHRPVHESKYIKGMTFLTPEDLGQYEQTNVIMKVNDKTISGYRYTLRYGAISTQFMKLHTPPKGRQPSKVDREVYAVQLQRAFEGLDAKLGGLVLAA